MFDLQVHALSIAGTGSQSLLDSREPWLLSSTSSPKRTADPQHIPPSAELEELSHQMAPVLNILDLLG